MEFRSLICLALIATAVPFVVTVFAQDRDASTLSAELREKRLEHRDTLRLVVDILQRRYVDGTDNINPMLEAQIALINAELAVTSAAEERVAVLRSHLSVLKRGEAYQVVRAKMGTGRTDELAKSKAARIYGEIMLLEEQLKQMPPDGGDSPNDVPEND